MLPTHRKRSSDSESSTVMPFNTNKVETMSIPIKRKGKTVTGDDDKESPPTYDAATAEERTCANLVGALMLKLSRVFGLNPFKPPYACTDDVCRRRGIRDRICIVDVLLCCFNFVVIGNNLRLHVLPQVFADTMNWSIFSPVAASMIQTTVRAVLPLVCIIGMMLCSFHMHILLQKLSDVHFRVIHMKCNRKAKQWKFFSYFLMVFFLIGIILQLPMNMIIEFSAAENETEIVNMPLHQIPSHLNKIVVFFDRYYFPIIEFGVVKIPQLIIMMISIRIAALFQIEAKGLKSMIPNKKNLANFFSRLIEIIGVLEMLECCFNKLILVIVGTTVTNIIFKSYVSITSLLLQGHGMNHSPTPLMVGGWVALFTAFQSFCTVFSLLLNALWVVLFIVPCIVCNELSRDALHVITAIYVEDADAKLVKDQIIQKLNDPTWGLTLGKFMKIDRTFAGTLMSFIFTVVVVWLQLDTSLPTKTT